MLDLHRQLGGVSGQGVGARYSTPVLVLAEKIIRPQIEATDREIDALVYELYDLTDEEVAIVEGG